MNSTANLQTFIKAERKAWRALMSDPACLADLTAPHTPAILKAWEDAAHAERAYREEHELLGC